MAESRDVILGIDLGTTNSLVAVCDASGPRVLEGEAGERTLPSVVRYTEEGKVEAVGHDARAHAVEYPDRTIASVKRLMGRARADAASDLAFLGYEVVEGEHATARVRLPGGTVLTPQEVSAVLLRSLRERAEASLGHAVERAVVTVPAYFDDAQRQATRDAGRLAGLDVVRIVNEPTAAALAYGVGLRAAEPETIAVFDLGGGTFDVSILQVTPADEGDDEATDFFQVLSTAGDTHLGGDDVDHMIIRLVLDEVQADLGRTLELPPHSRQALKALAEATKIRLSDAEDASIALELDVGPGETTTIMHTISREELERLMSPWVDRALSACERAMRDAKVGPDAIDRVVLVGGSTRIPLVRRRVAEVFQTEPYTALDPDEVVAMGAAVQASIISGGRDMLLLDVIPLSLGIETVGGAVAKLVLRNSTVPARAVERFSTSVDGQTSVKIHVLQGEREMVEHCRSLGVFHLRGVPPMPAGIPKLRVEFLVDVNGVLRVEAIEERSGKRASLQVVPSHGLSREEIERIEAESIEHAREDMTRHRVVDLVANAKLDVKWIRDRLGAVADDLEADYRDELASIIERLESMVQSAEQDWRTVDANAFHALKEQLDQASVRLHEVSIAASLRDEDVNSN
jgi:molecular chaperone DnaK (HSP70)